MQSASMKIIKDGDTIRVVPKTVRELEQDDIKTAMKRQAEIIKSLSEMVHGE